MFCLGNRNKIKQLIKQKNKKQKNEIRNERNL